MPTVTFTLNTLPSSSAKRLRFEPRDAPWVNTAGAVVTPDGFESSYPRGAAQSITLDTGPWRVRIGLSWYAFDVPAAGGDLAELITWSMPAGAPASTIAAAVAEFLTANPNGLLTQAAADANYAPLPTSSGTVGQVLTKTADGTAWATASGGGVLPSVVRGPSASEMGGGGAPTVSGIDAGSSATTNSTSYDAGSSATTNTTSYDAGSAAA